MEAITAARCTCIAYSWRFCRHKCSIATGRRVLNVTQPKSFRCRASSDDDLLTKIEERSQGAAEKSQDGSGKGFGKASPAADKKQQKNVQRPFQSPSSISQGPPPSAAATLEGYVIGLLTLIFVVFILEGIFLAISGFLPEEADNFALNVIYPAFSPTLGVFVAISAIYGLVKSRQGGSQ